MMENLSFNRENLQVANRTARQPKRKMARKKGQKKDVPELDVDEAEKNNVVEKLEYLLGDYPSLLDKATRNEKGQAFKKNYIDFHECQISITFKKTLIKRLWSDHEEVVEKCDINDLRHALWEPSFLSCTEALLIDFSTTCNHLGQVIYNCWRMAVKEEDDEMLKEIEIEMITGTLHAAILMPMNFSKKFIHILSAFCGPNVDKAKADGTLVKCFESILWIGLESCNDYVRYASSSILLAFYPLIDDDDFKRGECLYKQHSIIMSMLKDDCTPIRMLAAKKVLRILSMFWNFVPQDFIKQYMSFIVDTLSRDVVVGVRLAVYEGMCYLITVPACLNATEHALKCITLNGINDKSERVRVAAFEMLKMLKGHRYIKFFNVVPMEEVLARLQIETSESVRRGSFFPDRKRADQNERMRRIAFLIEHGRICALTFHRLLFPLGLITVKEAVEHIQFMTILVYRSFSKGMSADTSMDGTMQLDDTVGTLSGPNQQMAVPDEDNKVWIRNKVFLECVVVMWMSMRKVLMEPQYAVEKQKLDNLETKNTSLIGTTMLIGSMLPPSSMDGITQSVLSLLNEKVVDDCIMEPYLEATAQWKVEYLFEIINSGLSMLQTEDHFPSCSPLGKKRKTYKIPPVDCLRKSLRYLKYLLRSYSTNQMMTCVHLYQLEKFYEKLRNIRHIIDLRVSHQVDDVGISDDLIVEAFEMKQILAAVLINCKTRGEDDEAHIIRFVKDLCEELTWFDADVLSSMATVNFEDVFPFLICLSETILRCIGFTMAAFDFSQVKESYSSASDELSDIRSYPEIACKLVLSFCSSNTAGVLLPTVLNAAVQLLDNENIDFSSLLAVLDFIPKWIINCARNNDDIDEKATGDAYLMLWKVFLERNDYTDTMLDNSINICAILLLNYLTQLNEEAQDVSDPRMHDYEAPLPISIIIQRVLFKSKILITKFTTRLGALSCSEFLYSNDYDGNTCLLRLGSCAQLALLCDPISKGIRKVGNSTSTIRSTSQNIANLLVILRDRVEAVARNNPPDDNMILFQLREMFT
ncbi:HEAT repeat protein [Dictyocaulus viviparus]|uniref:HEAT repeat protein n=1 Tax=Dictyocaulus viviparus TaxID=29172 RepID=A0A0D8XLD3_DICVI|nr:HEAT repeat protein [Dictyocaulus viviparus]